MIDSIFWHDGNLVDVAFTLGADGAAAVMITVKVYPRQQVPNRYTLRIACQGVTRFACSLDVSTLADHMWAGHIEDGELQDSTLRLHFAEGGLLEVEAKAITPEPIDSLTERDAPSRPAVASRHRRR